MGCQLYVGYGVTSSALVRPRHVATLAIQMRGSPATLCDEGLVRTPLALSRAVAEGASVAFPGAGVGERRARHGDEFPGVALVVVQRELQQAVAGAVHFAVGRERGGDPGSDAAGTGDDFTQPAIPVERGGGRLRREPLVVVLMAVQHQLRSRSVERVPQRFDRRLRDGIRAAIEARRMPVGDGAAF